ncbi:hypothetical protein Tco_0352732 [Tanacetum coccineum]
MKEEGERYFTPCYVGGLHAYDGEINLKYEKNLISNEFAVKLCLEYEEKNREKLVKRELLVSLKGEFYFVKFIVNPEEDDVKPSVIFGRSFMRLAKGIPNFGNGIITIHLELDPFLDNSFIGTHDDEADSSSSHPKRARITKNVEETLMGHWNVLNTLGCDNAIEDMLEFDEAVADDELMTKKAIKFRLCGKAYAMSILDFSKRLGLYIGDEIQEYRFETYFIGGLRNDDDFSYDKVQKNKLWLLSMFEANHQNGYANVTWLIAKWMKKKEVGTQTLDANILRELIGSNGRLIPEEIAPNIPRVVTPRAPQPTTSDLYDKISQLETRIVTLRDPYNPPSYFEQQQQQDDEK